MKNIFTTLIDFLLGKSQKKKSKLEIELDNLKRNIKETQRVIFERESYECHHYNQYCDCDAYDRYDNYLEERLHNQQIRLVWLQNKIKQRQRTS